MSLIKMPGTECFQMAMVWGTREDEMRELMTNKRGMRAMNRLFMSLCIGKSPDPRRGMEDLYGSSSTEYSTGNERVETKA